MDVDALDVTQAPDGKLISMSLDRNALYFHKPIEAATTQLCVCVRVCTSSVSHFSFTKNISHFSTKVTRPFDV
jgi:hypothetical protein